MLHKISFTIEDFCDLKRVLNDLYLQGFITGYKQHKIAKYNFVEVFLKYDKATDISYILAKTATSPGKDAVISLKQLKAAEKNQPFSIGLIRTQKLGITSTKNAIANKEGGVFLARIT